MTKLKSCPECGSEDINVDSSSAARLSWAECNDCDFKLQAAVPEETIIARWNKLTNHGGHQNG